MFSLLASDNLFTCVWLIPLEYAVILKKYSTLISTLASADMDFTQLDAFLSSQMKKRQVCYIPLVLKYIALNNS